MSKNKKSFLENLFYNNKFLMVFCVLVAVIAWATVEINYSADTVRTVNDVKISFSSLNTDNSDFKVFVDESEIYAQVEVTGKAYNINSGSLSKDDIIVEATGSYSDSAGYRVLNLSAKIADTAGVGNVTITNITPSSITVYYDKEATGTFDVEAVLTNDLDSLVDDDYSVGQPVPSASTVKVKGPATIINKLSKVYFKASVIESDLPLSASKVVSAEIGYEVEKQAYEKYLVCEDINDESKPATVTVPIYVSEIVPTSLKYINQPSYYADNPLPVSINPSKVKIFYSSDENANYEFLNVGTVDFRELDNKVNKFTFEVDDSLPISSNEAIEKFEAVIDLSSMSKKQFAVNKNKIVLSNQTEGYTYTVDIKKSGLDSVTVIGPKESIEKLTAEDIQIEVNVSSLSVVSRTLQTVDISNISIVNSEVNDCWIYGSYKAVIDVNAIESENS